MSSNEMFSGVSAAGVRTLRVAGHPAHPAAIAAAAAAAPRKRRAAATVAASVRGFTI